MLKLSRALVERWVKSTTGDFSLQDIRNELGIESDEGKGHLRVIMFHLRKDAIVQSVGKRDGVYRLIDDELIPMKLSGANPHKVLDLRFPFELERFVRIYRKNVIILFGSKSAGKTAFLINLAKMNMGRFPIVYFNSDMGEEEFRMRLDKFEDLNIEEWDELIELYPRCLNFEDVIKADYINIVDFLEIFDEFYRIGEPIQKMASKLNNGILIVAIQKNPNVEVGLGGQRAMEKAKLVLSLDPGKIKIIEAKNWQEGIISSPKGRMWTYKLIGGARILNPIENIGGEE